MGSIILKDIKKSFEENTVIDNISLEIPDGSFTVILGPSGCGKSTLLRIISGLDYADSGEIWIDGQDATEKEPKDRDIAMVFQNYALYPHMTVFKNIEYGLKVQGMDKAKRKEKVNQAIATVQLQGHEDKLPSQLSGGQRQRVALARAIVKDPTAFLMDEPLSNLDAKLRVEMRKTLLDLHEELDATFIYVTHDQTEAMTMADQIVLLNGGHIMQADDPENMYTNPSNTFVADFIGNPPTNLVKTAYGFAGFRPEELYFNPPNKDHIKVKGEINFSEPQGAEIIYDIECDFGNINVKNPNDWQQKEGQVEIYIPKDSILYFDQDGERIYNPEDHHLEELEAINH